MNSRALKRIFYNNPKNKVLAIKISNFLGLQRYKESRRYQHQNENSIFVICHQGIGDIAAILPALTHLSKRYESIYISLWESRFELIKGALIIPTNIKPFEYNPSEKSFESQKFIARNKNFSVVKLGNYIGYPLIDYPLSFYEQLLVDKNIAYNKLQLRDVSPDAMRSINEITAQPYEYINMTSSSKTFESEYISSANARNKIYYLSPGEFLFISNGIHREIRINGNSLLINVKIAQEAQTAHLMDSAIFNILIRLANHPDIYVTTRKQTDDAILRQTHDPEFYPFPFDGRTHFVKGKSNG